MDEPILDYGVPPLRQRRSYGRLVRAILLLGLMAAVYFIGPPVWSWTQYIYWLQRERGYTWPPGQVVLEYDNDNYRAVQAHFATPEKELERWGFGSEALATIFIHEMRRPDGTPMIVVLDVAWCWRDSFQVNYSARQYDFLGISGLRIGHRGQQGFSLGYVGKRFDIFAGQLDPVNPSHCTFDYLQNGHRHTCDAWLNNSNQMVLSVRP